jgi:hypothetical protein
MKVLVATSNKYSFLLKPYSVLFNKYWPGQDVVFLGFEESKDIIPDLPENFSFHSLGYQESFNGLWTDPLIPYIDSIPDEYFVFTVEDMMPMQPVDQDKMDTLEFEIKNSFAEKALLDSHMLPLCESYKSGLVKLSQDADYRTTLHPAIWRKEYFRRYLKPGMSAWDFEVKNMPESKIDKATILLLDQTKNLFEAANVYRKGVPFPRWDCPRPYGGDNVNMQDVEYILEFINAQK